MESSRHHDLGVSTQKSPSKVKFSEDSVNVSVVQWLAGVNGYKTNSSNKIKDLSSRPEKESPKSSFFTRLVELLPFWPSEMLNNNKECSRMWTAESE